MSLSSDGLGPVVHVADTIAIGGLDSGETTVSPASAPGVLDDPNGHAIGNGLDDDRLALRVDLLLDLDDFLVVAALELVSLVDPSVEVLAIFGRLADLGRFLLLSGSTASSLLLDLLLTDDVAVVVALLLGDLSSDDLVADDDHGVVHTFGAAHGGINDTT